MCASILFIIFQSLLLCIIMSDSTIGLSCTTTSHEMCPRGMFCGPQNALLWNSLFGVTTYVGGLNPGACTDCRYVLAQFNSTSEQVSYRQNVWPSNQNSAAEWETAVQYCAVNDH